MTIEEKRHITVDPIRELLKAACIVGIRASEASRYALSDLIAEEAERAFRPEST